MNELKHLDTFQKVLSHYQLSEHGEAVLARVQLALLLAPSSTGRNTIINQLVQTERYQFIVSDTTRLPRSNNGVMEQEGVEYWFRTEEDMLGDLQSGNFLEAEIIHEQQVSGISIRELEKAGDSNKVAITDIEIGGMQNTLSLKPDTHVFLILPPSFEEWLKRLTGRGEMPNIELGRRMRTALRIFEYAPQEPRMKLVVNDSLPEAVRCVDEHITGQRVVEPGRQDEVIQLLEDLTLSTKKLLADIA